MKNVRRLPKSIPHRLLLAAAVLTIVAGSVRAPHAGADDRDLFRSVTSSGSPYFFFLMDTSSSFNFSMLNEPWIEPDDPTFYENCTSNQSGFDCYFGRLEYKDHDNDPSTPTVPNTYYLPGGADHPASRGYQAKKAIYSVLKELPEQVDVGFAHFPNRGVQVGGKKLWMYRSVTDVTTLPWYNGGAGLPIPRNDMPIRLGKGRNTLYYGYDGYIQNGCKPGFVLGSGGRAPDLVSLAGITFIGSFGTYPRDDFHRALRFHMFEKLGPDGATMTPHFTEWNGTVYRVDFEPLSGGQTIGDENLTVDVTVDECTSTTTTTTNSDGTTSTSTTYHLAGNPMTAQIELEPYLLDDGDGVAFSGGYGVVSDEYGAPVEGAPGYKNLYAAGPCGDGWDSNYDEDVYTTNVNGDSYLQYPGRDQLNYETHDDPYGRVGSDKDGDATTAESPFRPGRCHPLGLEGLPSHRRSAVGRTVPRFRALRSRRDPASFGAQRLMCQATTRSTPTVIRCQISELRPTTRIPSVRVPSGIRMPAELPTTVFSFGRSTSTIRRSPSRTRHPSAPCSRSSSSGTTNGSPSPPTRRLVIRTGSVASGMSCS